MHGCKLSCGTRFCLWLSWSTDRTFKIIGEILRDHAPDNRRCIFKPRHQDGVLPPRLFRVSRQPHQQHQQGNDQATTQHTKRSAQQVVNPAQPNGSHGSTEQVIDESANDQHTEKMMANAIPMRTTSLCTANGNWLDNGFTYNIAKPKAATQVARESASLTNPDQANNGRQYD